MVHPKILQANFCGLVVGDTQQRAVSRWDHTGDGNFVGAGLHSDVSKTEVIKETYANNMQSSGRCAP